MRRRAKTGSNIGTNGHGGNDANTATCSPVCDSERLDDTSLGVSVHGARDLVAQQHGRVLEQRTREAHPLPFAARQRRAVLPHAEEVPTGAPLDALVHLTTRAHTNI